MSHLASPPVPFPHAALSPEFWAGHCPPPSPPPLPQSHAGGRPDPHSQAGTGTRHLPLSLPGWHQRLAGPKLQRDGGGQIRGPE